jgi:hypothetical protein
MVTPELNPRRKELARLLTSVVGAAANTFYIDAVALLSSEYASKTQLIGHLLREIDGSILNLWGNEPPKDSKEKRAYRIDDIAKFFEMDENTSRIFEIWKALEFHRVAHRNTPLRPRTDNDSLEEIMAAAETTWIEILPILEAQYLSVVTLAKRLRNIPSPTNSDIKIFEQKLPHSAATHYFFFAEGTPSTEWFLPLYERGYLRLPEAGTDGQWHQLSFLLEEVDNYPKEITTLANELTSGHTCFIHSDVVKLSLRLGSENLVSIAQKSIDWLSTLPELEHFSPDHHTQLISKLVANQEIDIALDLAEKLLALVPFDPQRNKEIYRVNSLIREWDYARTLRLLSAPLGNANPRGFLLLISRLTLEACSLQMGAACTGSEEHSDLWRPFVSLRTSPGVEILDDLIDCLRDNLSELVGNQRISLAEACELLDAQNSNVCKRLLLHLLETSEFSISLVEKTLLNSRNQTCYGIHNEYSKLLSFALPRLTEESRNLLVNQLIALAHSEDEASLVSELANMKLQAITSHLTPEELARCEGLDKLDTLYTGTTRVDRSFVAPSIENLLARSNDEIVEKINESASSSNSYDAYHSAGLLLNNLTKADPLRLKAENMMKLDPPSLLSYALSSFLNLLNESAALDWEEIRKISRIILNNPDSYDSSTREYAGSVIASGYRSNVIPEVLDEDFFAIAEHLAQDEDLKKKDMTATAGSWMSTVRGEALHCLIMLAANYRSLGKAETALFKNCLAAIEHRLPLSAERSPAVRGVFGMYLHILQYIDPSWFELQRQYLLPVSPDALPEWTAVMSNHLLYGRPLSGLNSDYLLAMRRMDILRPTFGNMGKYNQLPVFIIHLYTSGAIQLENPLMGALFNDEELAIEALISCAIPKDDHTPILTEKLIALWEWQLTMVESNSSTASDRLKTFGRWFSQGAYNDIWGLKQLENLLDRVGLPLVSYQVMEQLSEASIRCPREALTDMEKMFEHAGTWDPAQWYENAAKLMQHVWTNAPTERKRISDFCGRQIGQGWARYDIHFSE